MQIDNDSSNVRVFRFIFSNLHSEVSNKRPAKRVIGRLLSLVLLTDSITYIDGFINRPGELLSLHRPGKTAKSGHIVFLAQFFVSR